jgi:pyruvate-ferredoxin/flavodoxin oxidoreductase
MHEDLERTAESPSVSSTRATPVRLEMLDVAGAIGLADRLCGARALRDATENGDLAQAIAEACSIADKGDRATLIAPVERLATVRDALRRAASVRLGLVAHAIASNGSEDLAALCDLGWGVLCASGPEDSFDLSLVARRAAEDSGVPFIVVHGLARATQAAGRAIASVAIPQDRVVQAFVGPLTRARPEARSSAGDRAYAERVPFALGAAFREYATVSGRRHDVFDKVPLGEAPLVLVGMGPVGDALVCATTELRARGYDVGAVQLTSLRPFPGQRLVKTLARALAITILEPCDEPLAHGALLARDVKSAFTDALTWVPGFPGIGRIPKLFVGACGSAFDVADLVAVCENMLADERGRRVFSFTEVEHALPRAAAEPPRNDTKPEREVAVRFVLDDVATAESVLSTVGSALASGVGLRTQGIITATTPGAGAVLDVLASRDHARGGMARRAPRLVVATERGVTSAGAVVPLPEGAVLGVLGVEPSRVLPEAARTMVRERRARVLPLATGDAKAAGALAAVAAGVALALASRALKTPLDAGEAARVVMESMPGPDAEAAGQRGRRAFEATCEVLAAGARPEPDPSKGPIGVA